MGRGMPPMNVLIDKHSLKGTYCTLVIDELGGHSGGVSGTTVFRTDVF